MRVDEPLAQQRTLMSPNSDRLSRPGLRAAIVGR